MSLRRWLLAASLLHVACQPKIQLPGLIEYSCQGGKKFYVDFGENFDPKKPFPAKTTVHYDETAVRIPQTASPTGVRYSDDMTTYWSKGDEATLKTSQGKYEGCKAVR